LEFKHVRFVRQQQLLDIHQTIIEEQLSAVEVWISAWMEPAEEVVNNDKMDEVWDEEETSAEKGKKKVKE
jgi:hypothetical protein